MLKTILEFAVYVFLCRALTYKLPYALAEEQFRKTKTCPDWLELVFFFIGILFGALADILIFGRALSAVEKAGITGLSFYVHKFASVGCYAAPMLFSGICAVTVNQEIRPNCKDD